MGEGEEEEVGGGEERGAEGRCPRLIRCSHVAESLNEWAGAASGAACNDLGSICYFLDRFGLDLRNVHCGNISTAQLSDEDICDRHLLELSGLQSFARRLFWRGLCVFF